MTPDRSITEALTIEPVLGAMGGKVLDPLMPVEMTDRSVLFVVTVPSSDAVDPPVDICPTTACFVSVTAAVPPVLEAAIQASIAGASDIARPHGLTSLSLVAAS